MQLALRLALVTLFCAGCGTLGQVQPSTATTTMMAGWERHFSIEWAIEPEGNGARRLRGYLYNNHGEFALSVRILARALDPSGAVVGQRIEWIPQGVNGFARTYFEVPHMPVAERYQVTVWDYTWFQSDGDKK